MMNAMMPLIAPSGLHDRKHTIAMYVPQNTMPFKCCNMSNGSCAQRDNYVSMYASHELTLINNGGRYTGKHKTSHYWHMPLNKYACHSPHICSTTMLFLYTFRHHITALIH